MSLFKLHTIETATSQEMKQTLQEVEARYGFVPNLGAALVESPPTLRGMYGFISALEEGTLTAAEREITYIAASVANKCDYCTTAHCMLGKMNELDTEAINGIRKQSRLQEARQETLRHFTTALVQQRGNIPAAEIQSFLDAGFTRAQIFEVLGIIAIKTLTNYANHLVGTPIGPQFKS